MQVHIKPGSGVNGAGDISDPFTVDSTTDLDDILNGTYTGSTAASSGDEIILHDGDYGAVRLNNTDVNGILFAALCHRQAKVASGFGISSSDGTANFEIEGIFFDYSGSNVPMRASEVTLNGCAYHVNTGGGRLGYNGNFHKCTWNDCEFYWKSTYTEMFHSNGGTQYFNNSTVVLDTSYSSNPVLMRSTSMQFNECIISCLDQQLDGWALGGSFLTSANNWVHNMTGDKPANIGTSDPIFIDPANKIFRLNIVASPCRGLGQAA